jgi:thioredoxin reductase
VRLTGGDKLQASKLLLATGVLDDLPPIAGLAERWGRSVFPCPYCDAYELRGRSLGVLGWGPAAVAQCRALTTWSDRLALFLDGRTDLDSADREALAGQGVRIVSDRVRALEGAGAALERVRLASGDTVACEALFLSAGQHQRSPLVEQLGCPIVEGCAVRTHEHESTDIPGLYVAGDASENLQLAIVAAAEGAEAGFAINRALVRDSFAARTGTPRILPDGSG